MAAQRLNRLAQSELQIRGNDGRTVFGIAVPYDVESTVNDGRGEYREVFRPGAFTRTIRERGPAKVKLLLNHDRRAMPIGRAVNLSEDKRGLVGEFHVSQTAAGDEALELIRDGALDSFSVGFSSVRERAGRDGLVERLECRLAEVSVCAFPAYEGAVIAGVRSDVPTIPIDVARQRLALLERNLLK